MRVGCWWVLGPGVALLAGCLHVEDKTPSVLIREATSVYPLTVHIEKRVPGVGIGSVQAITSWGQVPMVPGAGPGEWVGTLALDPCVAGFSVRYEAPWSFQASGNTAREPYVGAHQKWIDGAPDPGCSAVAGFGRRFIVNSTADSPDNHPGDGQCRAADRSGCTLRAAIMEANALPGQDRIEIGSATYVLSRPADGDEDDASIGDLDVLDPVAIVGQGAVIDAGRLSRVFDVGAKTAPSIDVELRGITLQNGLTTADGGGIRNRSRLHLVKTVVRNNQAHVGGGIGNGGSFVEIDESRIDGNAAAELGARGGGLYSEVPGAVIVIRGSSIVANRALSQHGGGLAMIDGALDLRNSTISGNQADVLGGGVYLGSRVTAELRHVTITDNVADADGSLGNSNDPKGGGLSHTDWESDGTRGQRVRLSHTVIAGNRNGGGSHDDCGGHANLYSRGYNLIGAFDNVECQGLVDVDHSGTPQQPLDPGLGPLTTLGNGTQAHVPRAGSPLLDQDAGPPNDAEPKRCSHHDQRGVDRPKGPEVAFRVRCDIGSIERT